MTRAALLCAALILLILAAGCTARQPNREISVTSSDLDSPEIANIGSVDMYTPQFRITNPTNRTFSDITVQIDVTPLLTYCHPATKSFEIPALAPGGKRIVQVPVAEFANLDCQYAYSFSVLSDP